RIAICLGGRIAEEIIFGQMTTGAGNDIEKATDLARKMVTEFGMSDKLGPLTLGAKHGPVFLGRDLVESRNYSEEIAYEIDKEVRRIIDECYGRARQVLTEHKPVLERISRALLERESLESDDLDLLIAGQPLPPDMPETPPLPGVTQEVKSFPRPDSKPVTPSLKPEATG
ncbi:MAG TPA: cell division protein FtsH, partial [bacterium]|nr:cell division protein FtsH [bacterium]